MLIDSHCHLFKEDYNNIDIIIKNAQANNVEKLIVSGFDLNSNKEALELAKKHSNIYVTLGQHPDNITDFEKNYLFVKEHLFDEKVVGIGEIGLDYFHNNQNKSIQIAMFTKMLSLATSADKAIVIHSRNAFEETYNILKEIKQNVVIHSFSGVLEEAEKYIKLRFYLGINGILTFKNSNLKEVLKNIPCKHLILETDSPYLAPVPLRGLINEPKNILIIASYLADIYHLTLEELSQILENNIKDIFDI